MSILIVSSKLLALGTESSDFLLDCQHLDILEHDVCSGLNEGERELQGDMCISYLIPHTVGQDPRIKDCSNYF